MRYSIQLLAILKGHLKILKLRVNLMQNQIQKFYYNIFNYCNAFYEFLKAVKF